MNFGKTYKVISITNFSLHTLVFVLIIVATFLPFRNSVNYYTYMSGFFGTPFPAVEPYLLLLLPSAGAVISFFTIKKPWYSIWILILFLVFFVIVAIPYALEGAFTGFSAYISGQEFKVLPFEIGFKLIMDISYIIYWEALFFVYSLVTLILNGKKSKKIKE